MVPRPWPSLTHTLENLPFIMLPEYRSTGERPTLPPKGGNQQAMAVSCMTIEDNKSKCCFQENGLEARGTCLFLKPQFSPGFGVHRGEKNRIGNQCRAPALCCQEKIGRGPCCSLSLLFLNGRDVVTVPPQKRGQDHSLSVADSPLTQIHLDSVFLSSNFVEADKISAI